MLGFGNYNYAHFSRDLLDDLARAPFSGPEAGDRAPDFTASTLEGEIRRLSDFKGKKNVLLLFGSVTCPMTSASLGGISRLYERFHQDVEFLFIYVREAHPGENVPAHGSRSDKIKAARLLRQAEGLKMPVLVDDVRGSIHRQYSGLPNPAFLISKSGQVAFRAMWSRPKALESAIEELLELQQKRGREREAVVCGGQDLVMPVSYGGLAAYRALERGGRNAVSDFLEAMGRNVHAARAEEPEDRSLAQKSGRILAVSALTAAVLAGGLYAGFELRRRRLGTRRNPYRAYEKEKISDADSTDYGAVGI